MYNLTFESSYPTPYSSSPFLFYILLSMAGQKHTPDTKTVINDTYDYIVVGSGSAGSIVASRLAEKECVSVLLLEAGKSPPKLTDLPIISTSFVNTDLDWQFKTVPQKYTDANDENKILPLSAGKTVGGTSSIGDLVSVRGNKKDYDSWAAQGASGWSYEGVLPYFKKLEDNTDPEYVKNGYHGVGGPVTITKAPYESELKNALFEAAELQNYSIRDVNGDRQNGFYDLQGTTRRGQRCSTAKAYLVPNEHRKNFDIVANAYVRKVIINNRQAEGVVFDFQGETREVTARREVILSAGAIKSPHILMLSGIGPKDELTKHNIPVIADLPVGLSLQEHWGLLSLFELSDQIPSLKAKQSYPYNIWKYIETKTGPLASLHGAATMAFLLKNGLEGPSDFPDYEVYWGEAALQNSQDELKDRNEFLETMFKPSEDKSIYWCLSQVLRPKARGVVYLNSSDPYDSPLIDPMYFSHPEDMDIAITGMKKCKEISDSEPLQEIGSKSTLLMYPGCEDAVTSDEKYDCITKSIMISSGHLSGTVKMGCPDDPLTVLDPQLRVKTIRNLRVVDASVMPSIISGHTLVPTMMIGEKASDMIKENIQCPS